MTNEQIRSLFAKVDDVADDKTENCTGCKYYVKARTDGGYCQRWPPTAVDRPKTIWVDASYWCGEYVDAPKKK